MPRALKMPVRFSVGRNRRAAVGSKSDSPKFPDCAVIAATIRASAVALAARKKGRGDTGKTPFPDFPRACNGYALREYGAHREDTGQPFCLRRAFHFEITRRNVLSSARKAGISAAPAETRGSQARAIMASLKLDFPVKNVQVFGRYRRNPPNSYGRPLFVVAFLLYWCKKGAQFLHALKYRFAPAAVFYSPRRTFPFRRIILW